MAIKTEQGCYIEHLERELKFDHEKIHHKGVAEHGHYHPGAGDHRSDTSGASHHGKVEKHDNYTPEHGGYLHYHTHPHTHEGDPLAVRDVGTNEITNEITVVEHVSSNSYSEDLFSHLGSSGDSPAEVGVFLETCWS